MTSTTSTGLTGRIIGSYKTGLKLLYTRWSSSQQHQPVAVYSECCGTPGVFFPEALPCVATSSTTALAEDRAANRVQACSACLSLSPWSGTTIPTQPVSSLDTRRGLRSSTTNALVVPPTRLSSVGDWAFPVAAARVWNSLPVSVTSSATLNTFKQRLKTELFIRCYDLPSTYARKHSV